MAGKGDASSSGGKGGKDAKDGKDDKKLKAVLAAFGKSVDGMDKQVDDLQKLISQAGKGMDDKMGKQIDTAVEQLKKSLDAIGKHNKSLDAD